ncbi:MAG TPA: DUF6361 family protein [Polyangiaceae bacterium]|jgi:hypothetical protein|nr:DUF6361 family protein [Polyangiaceae bacterium]
MPSFVAWVDYSSAERQRMRQAVALFEEKDTRDELGIGSIRDAFADELFPGTSIIQTRLRYVLFVPWVYARLEEDSRVNAATVEQRARADELRLVKSLLGTTDTLGVIGKRSGNALQRTPGSIYWLAMQRWGVFRHRWTIDEYHRRWDRVRSARQGQLRTDDRGVGPDPVLTWHAELPGAPADLFDGAGFELRREEAEFIRERIADTCRESLLAYAATAHRRPGLAAAEPWLEFEALPEGLAQTLALARRFALLVQGAALAYNLALARQLPDPGEVMARLEGELAVWARDAEALAVARSELDDLWRFCARHANVSPRTRAFIEAWRGLLAAEGYLSGASSERAARLVEERERMLKGSRSRFANPRALELWGGKSGTALLTYRWGTVKQLLGDLYRGLEREGH